MTNRVILGANSSGTYGLFVSQPGYDVFTAAQQNLLFDSRLGYFGSVVATGIATPNSTVSFGPLPYIPLAFVQYYNSTTGQTTSPTFSGPNGGANNSTQTVSLPQWTISNSSLSIQNVTWVANGVTIGGSYSVKYLIWRCPGV